MLRPGGEESRISGLFDRNTQEFCLPDSFRTRPWQVMDRLPSGRCCTSIRCVWLGRRGLQTEATGQSAAMITVAAGGSCVPCEVTAAQEIAFLEEAEERGSEEGRVGGDAPPPLNSVTWHLQTDELGAPRRCRPHMNPDPHEQRHGEPSLDSWLTAAAQTLQTEWPALRNHSGPFSKREADDAGLERDEGCSLWSSTSGIHRASVHPRCSAVQSASRGATCAWLGPDRVSGCSAETCSRRNPVAESDQGAAHGETLAKVKEFLHTSTITENGASPGYTLPASFLLINGGEVVGHARLQAAALPGCPAQYVAASYVVVEERLRGRGWGRVLMGMVEAVASGHWAADYVILRTRTAAHFYEKLGYHRCSSMESAAPCLARLSSSQRGILNATLRRLLQHGEQAPRRTGDRPGACETEDGVHLPTARSQSQTSPWQPVRQQRRATTLTSPPDVCLRKRVGRCVEKPVSLTWVERCTQVAAAVRRLSRCPHGAVPQSEYCYEAGSIRTADGVPTGGGGGVSLLPAEIGLASTCTGVVPSFFRMHNGTTMKLLDVPWCKQVGPACGISAICMAAAFLTAQSERSSSGVEAECRSGHRAYTHPDISFLGDRLLALAKLWQISRDGELFSIGDFVRLAREGAGLDAVQVKLTQAGDLSGSRSETEWSGNHGEEPVWLGADAADKIAYFLDRKWLLVLPFDSAGGHVVCQRGQKAHYGVVVGACFFPGDACREPEDAGLVKQADCLKSSVSGRFITCSDSEVFFEPGPQGLSSRSEVEESLTGAAELHEVIVPFCCGDNVARAVTTGKASLADVAVVLQHGRSRILMTERWTEVQASNAQLYSVDKCAHPDVSKVQLNNSAVLFRGIQNRQCLV